MSNAEPDLGGQDVDLATERVAFRGHKVETFGQRGHTNSLALPGPERRGPLKPRDQTSARPVS